MRTYVCRYQQASRVIDLQVLRRLAKGLAVVRRACSTRSASAGLLPQSL